MRSTPWAFALAATGCATRISPGRHADRLAELAETDTDTDGCPAVT